MGRIWKKWLKCVEGLKYGKARLTQWANLFSICVPLTVPLLLSRLIFLPLIYFRTYCLLFNCNKKKSWIMIFLNKKVFFFFKLLLFFSLIQLIILQISEIIKSVSSKIFSDSLNLRPISSVHYHLENHWDQNILFKRNTPILGQPF